MMKKKTALIFIIVFCFSGLSLAETVVLKSGKEISGKILRRTDKLITINSQGASATYFVDEIATVMPERPAPAFKTLKITYKTTDRLLDEKGSPVHEALGERIKYIDVVNNKIRTEEKTTRTMGDYQTQEDKLEIFDGKKLYSIDLKRKEGFFMDMPDMGSTEKDKFPAYIDLWPSENEDKFFKGTEDVLGRKCHVYSLIKGSRIWLWNGIILKDENKANRVYNLTEAVNIEENIPIEAGKFDLPKDVVIKSVDESMADALKQFNVNTATENKVTDLEKAGIADLGKAIYNPAEEEKFVNAIKEDKTISEDKKEEMIKNFQAMTTAARKTVESARAEDGKINLDQAINALNENRKAAMADACKSNLKLIQSMKELWAMDNNKPNDAAPTWDELKPYLIHAPKCPTNGTYTTGKVKNYPTCSIKEHNLTAAELK